MPPEYEMAPSAEAAPGAVSAAQEGRGSSAADPLQTKAPLDGALKHAGAGLPVFPCRNAPGQDGHKAPLTKHGHKDATTDERQIRQWWAKYPNALIGMPTGAVSGIAVLDIDRKNGKDGFPSVPGWKGLTPLRVETGNGGAHLYFQAHRPIRNATGSDGVDVRGEGGYVIVPPSEGYSWAEGEAIDPANLPAFPIKFLPVNRAPDPSDEGLVAPEPGLVAAALRAIPNSDEDWEEWNRIGMATWAASGGEDFGFEAFDLWSRKSTKYSIQQTRARWDHFRRSPPSQIGFGTLFYMADEADPRWLDRYEREQEAAALAMFEEGQAAYLKAAGKPAPEPIKPETSDRPVENGAGSELQPDADPTPAEPIDTPEQLSSSLLEEWDAGLDSYVIPPRAWLLGNTYCRQFVSSLLATGGGGKTAMRIAQAISCATGRELTGEKVFVRSRVLYASLEDDVDELRRRVRAAMLFHKVSAAELEGWLYLAAPGQKAGKLVTTEPASRSRRSDARVRTGQMLDEIKAAISARQIDVLMIDPLVKAHDVEENDNTAMDFVISTLTQLAIDHNIAVDVLHHTSKGAADPGNADRGRGASAVNNGARLVYTLSTMNADEARTFSIPENERRSYVRIDSGKVNIAPPLRDAKWFQIVGVDLRNSNPDYPSGDNVQTVVPWTPPDVWEGATEDIRQRILEEIDAGVPEASALKGKPGSRYSRHHNAGWRIAWPVVQRHLPDKSEDHCKKMVNDWVSSGALIEDDYTDPNTSQKAKGLRRSTQEDRRNAVM